MTRFILASLVIASAALLSAAPASAHGCHRGWHQGGANGWHSHGPKCDARQGLGVSHRAKAVKRRPS